MGSLNPENVPKQELNDSGYVQDEAAARETLADTPVKTRPSLLDLSDDVLLDIFKYCSPRDLKALGFTCPRLGTVVLDRTLWQKVDARDVPTGRKRMRWLLTHALSVHTTSLLLSGFAKEAKGCLGYMSGTKKETQEDDEIEDAHPLNLTVESSEGDNEPRLMRLSAQALPRYGGGFPYWPEQPPAATASYRPRSTPAPEHTGHQCPGPQVTLTNAALARLTALCTNLTELALDHVVIDCNMTKICNFPKTLRKLSLLGTKCFNLEKSFLYKIQDRLVDLEDLDVSYCEWIEPACMLPLSKMARLSRLVMQECPKLSEFVAYASLATRYGFKTLRILDLRGSPVGDSEVSALGWVPHLEQLFLSPAAPLPRHADHAHFSCDPPPAHTELTAWEAQEPDYYKSKYASEQWVVDELKNRPNRNVPTDDNAVGSCVLLQHVAEPAPTSPSRVLSRDCGLVAPHRPADAHTRENNQRLSMEQQIFNARREREEARITASMGYILSNNGCRRTINMYPDHDTESDEEILMSSQERVKRKQGCADGGGPAKRMKESEGDREGVSGSSEAKRGSGASSEAKSSSSGSSEAKSSSSGSKKCSDDDSDAKNEQGSSEKDKDSSSNEPASKEPCATKASRKYYDDADCQVSRTVLKDSISDFKKRTQDFYGPIYKPPRDGSPKPDFVDSDDQSNMDNDDDEDDDDPDDMPQPKRSRLAINEGASTSKVDESRPSTSKSVTTSNQSSEQATQPSCSNRSPAQPGTSSTQPDRPSTQPDHSNCDSNYEILNDDLSFSSSSGEINDTINQLVITKFLPSFDDPNLHERGLLGNYPDLLDGNGPARQAIPERALSPNNQPVLVLNREPVYPLSLEDEPGRDFRPNQARANPSSPSNPQQSNSNAELGQPSTSAGQPPKQGNEPQKFVRFRHNEPPVIVEGCSAGCSSLDNNLNNMFNNNNSQEPDWNNRFTRRDPMICGVPDSPEERLQLNPGFASNSSAVAAGNAEAGNAAVPGNAVEPNIPEENAASNELRRHRILYVNVGRRRHAMYQISMPEAVDVRTRRQNTAHMNLIYSSQIAPRLEYTSLVTDAAIRRFGRADNDNINYVQIGPMGPMPAPFDDPHARPNRSNLRVLSVTGFRHVTNYSLSHLVTAAPRLEFVDFTGTRVSEAGVEHFRSFRPGCRVRYGPMDKEVDDFRPDSR